MRQRRSKTAKQRQTRSKTAKQKGGFIPSVMEGFCAATSKYIVPITLLLAHKLLQAQTRRKKAKKTAGK
jgi:S-adenosylmethionine synthetase